MRCWTLFSSVLVATTLVMSSFVTLSVVKAQTDHGMPSQARLAEMGLAGMEILPEPEAETVRVSGRPPNRWGDLYAFVHGLSRLDREPARRPPQVRKLW